MTNSCNKLLETYNTNILSTIDPKIKNLFLTTAKISNQIHLKKGNKILLSLLNNYIKNDTPTPQYIGGPKTLSLHWNKEYQMTIYIFGEYHHSETDCHLFPKNIANNCPKGQIRNPKSSRCVSKTGVLGKKLLADNSYTEPKTQLIENFLFDLVKTTPVFLDIYIEFAAFKEMGHDFSYIPGQRVGKIFDKLKNCLFTYSRDSSLCDLLRLHYIDIRKGDKEVNPISYLRKLINYNFSLQFHSRENIIKKFKHLLKTDTKFLMILKNLNSFELEDFKKYMKNQILDNPPTLKEMNKSFLKDKILSFVTENIVQTGLQQREYLQKYIHILLDTKSTDSQLLDALSVLNNSTVMINARVVDVYTLSRIFKKFDTKKSKDVGFNINYQPEIPHNIIIYAGDAHSDVYRKFLKYIGSEEIAMSGPREIKNSPINNCLDLTNFPMPFFNSFPPQNN